MRNNLGSNPMLSMLNPVSTNSFLHNHQRARTIPIRHTFKNRRQIFTSKLCAPEGGRAKKRARQKNATLRAD